MGSWSAFARGGRVIKATLEFNLPEDADDHKFALAGYDALFVIDDLLSEIRSYLKYESGYFKDFNVDPNTLEKVQDLVIILKQSRRLPELV